MGKMIFMLLLFKNKVISDLELEEVVAAEFMKNKLSSSPLNYIRVAGS